MVALLFRLRDRGPRVGCRTCPRSWWLVQSGVRAAHGRLAPSPADVPAEEMRCRPETRSLVVGKANARRKTGRAREGDFSPSSYGWGIPHTLAMAWSVDSRPGPHARLPSATAAHGMCTGKP